MNGLKLRSCCFSGHRRLPEDQKAAIMASTEEKVRELIGGGTNRFLVGGAVGYDTEVAKLLFHLKSEWPDIEVVLIYPFDGYTDRWNDAQKAEYAELLPQYNEVIKASERSGRDAYLLRNRMLVDSAAYCIAYCTHQRSGAAYTLRYARGKATQVFNIADT